MHTANTTSFDMSGLISNFKMSFQKNQCEIFRFLMFFKILFFLWNDLMKHEKWNWKNVLKTNYWCVLKNPKELNKNVKFHFILWTVNFNFISFTHFTLSNLLHTFLNFFCFNFFFECLKGLTTHGYNARKVNCSCVYSAYILKPVLSGRNL